MNRALQLVLALSLVVFLSSCATRHVAFDSTMESGNGHLFQEIAPDTYTFEIENDTNSSDRQWFMFDVTGARGRTLTFQMLDTQRTNVTSHWNHARPIYSRDGGETWDRVAGDTEHDNNIYTFSHTFARQRERIAMHYPYTWTMALEKIEEWKQHPYATHTVLGQSVQGRDIHFFRVTDETVGNDMDKRGFWIVGRQHSAETTGSFTVEALMDFILSDDPKAVALRRGAVVNIAPMANPDGTVAGNYRNNFAGVNLNRVWDGSANLENSPEIYHIQGALDAWVAEGKPYDIFLDFHSTSASGPHFAFHPNSSHQPELYHDPAEYFNDTRAYLALVNEHCAHFHPTRGASGSNDQRLAYHRQREQYGVIALTPEGTYSQVGLGPEEDDYLTPRHHREVGVGFAKALVDYFGLD